MWWPVREHTGARLRPRRMVTDDVTVRWLGDAYVFTGCYSLIIGCTGWCSVLAIDRAGGRAGCRECRRNNVSVSSAHRYH